MAYEPETKKMLAGSVSWLSPLDTMADDDACDLRNFRCDEAGNLKSRLGHTSLASGLGVVNSLIRANGIRYAGASGSLYRGLSSAIASGFDGNPLGLLSWRKFLLCTNQSNAAGFNSPIKDNGSAVSRWMPAPPTVAPTVVKSAERTTTVSTFDNTETWTPSTSLTVTFDATDVKAGTHSLKASFTDPGTYTITRTASPNLDSVGGQTGTDNDKHRIWVKATDWRQLGTIALIVDASSASDFTNYYRAEIPRKMLKKAKGNWIQFEIRRAPSVMDLLVVDPNETDLLRQFVGADQQTREGLSFSDLPVATRTLISQNALTFERFGNDETRNWSTITQIRLEIEARGATDVHFDQWEVFGSVLGQVEGRKMTYYYTYLTADGTESNPSVASNILKFNRVSAGVSVTASSEAQVTGIHVYRTGGTLGAVYRVTTTAEPNTTHQFVDITSDDDLTALGIFMEIDNDDPPSAAGAIGPFFGRAILFNSAANSNRFWWSKTNRLSFPGSNSVSGNWADIGASGEPILAATMHQQVITFFKSNQIWRLIGDPDDASGEVEQTRSKRGIVGPRAVCAAEGGDFFADTEGLYWFNGEVPQEISQKIAPIFRNRTVDLGNGNTIPPIDAGNKSKIALEYINGRLYMSYPSSGQSANNVSIVLHTATGRWYPDSRGLSALYNDSNALLGGTSGGSVLQLESGVTDGGSAIPLTYQSKYEDCNVPDTQKTFEDIEIECDAAGQTLTVQAIYDNGTSAATLGTISGSGRQKALFQLVAANPGEGKKAFNVSVRITGNVSTEVTIYGIWLHFYPESRIAKSFDTDESDLGSPGVKQVRQIELDIDCSQTSILKVFSDLPGNAMVSRETPTIPATTTRRVVANMLSQEWRGRLHRYVMDDSTARLQIYALRVEYKVIGDYVSANEVWDSDELDFGTTSVKNARSIRVELENTAAVTVKIYSDLPDGTLDEKETITISSTGSRRVVNIPFNSTYSGYLFRVTMVSTADWVLYGAAMELQIVGTYISGSTGNFYDSGELDWGTERVKWLKEIEIDVSGTYDLTVQVKSDLPGGLVVNRFKKLMRTEGRRVLKIPTPATFKGRLHQYILSSLGDFVIYAARVWVKAVGSPGATPWNWLPLPLTPTQTGIWTFQELPVVKTGSNQWTWYSFPIDKAA